MNAVTYATLMQCLRSVWRFWGFPEREGETVTTVEDLDRSIVWYMDHAAYEDQQSAQAGKNARSGVIHLIPGLKKELPVSAMALGGWERQEGVIEREPLCLEFQALVIESVAKRNQRMGWACFSQLRDGLRGQDIQVLRGTDIKVGDPTP